MAIRHTSCDADKKIKRRLVVVNFKGFPIKFAVRKASVKDRDKASAVILGMLEKAAHVTKLWADGGCQGLKLAPEPEEL